MKNNLIFISIVMLFALQGCNSVESNPVKTITEKIEMQKPGFIHTVFFWMKEDITDADHQKFKNELVKLEKCPTIQSVYWGPPAAASRDVVDGSYDYAWVVHFENAADQDAYQVDPIHLAFIESCKDLWERVQVYDNLVEN